MSALENLTQAITDLTAAVDNAVKPHATDAQVQAAGAANCRLKPAIRERRLQAASGFSTHQKIMNVQQLLAGKKTYLLALAAILYLLGAHLGWWPLDDKILDALGFGGLITLRAGVKKLQDGKLFEPLISANKNPNPDRSEDSSPLAVKTPLPALGVLCALCGILLSGCASVGSNP